MPCESGLAHIYFYYFKLLFIRVLMKGLLSYTLLVRLQYLMDIMR